MSTQSAPNIPFTYTTPQQHFRLLELPPELLELLTSHHPPTLKLKSAPPSPTSPNNAPTSGGTSTDGTLHLCTPTRTYQVRQVQSSNSVFLVLPTTLPQAPQQRSGGAVADGVKAVGWDPSTASAALTAVAQCSATLELVATMQHATSFLERLMPMWYGMDAKGRGERDAGARSRAEIFADTPVSEREFEDAWTALCCFELGGVESYRPSSKACLKVWEKIMQSCTLNDIRLDGPGSCGNVLGIFLGGMGEGELDEPFELMQSVLKRVADAQGGVDRDRAVDWVGNVLLEVETEDSGGMGVKQSDFEERWKGLVLEKWRNDARLKILDKKTYRYDPREQTIQSVSQENGGKRASGALAPASAVTAPNKRKWHEKFKVERT